MSAASCLLAIPRIFSSTVVFCLPFHDEACWATRGQLPRLCLPREENYVYLLLSLRNLQSLPNFTFLALQISTLLYVLVTSLRVNFFCRHFSFLFCVWSIFYWLIGTIVLFVFSILSCGVCLRSELSRRRKECGLRRTKCLPLMLCRLLITSLSKYRTILR